MTMFKKNIYAKPADYIASLDEPRKTEIRKLDALIRKTVPTLKPFTQVGMLAYGPFHYKSKSGREGEWAVVALASQKNYISLYICVAEDGKYIPERYKKELPKASIGRSCIRFKRTEDIDLGVITEILSKSEKWWVKNGK